jgi:serine/threonine protein kinase
MRTQSATPFMHDRTSPDESAYDAYLDACLAGDAEAPDVFCARHPSLTAAVRAQIESCHRALVANDADTAANDAPPFERLGDFRLERRLGAGGMGVVYLAEQVSLGRPIALKVLRPELAGSAVAAERLRREALAVARLRHPNIVSVHAVGEDRSVRYVAMEFVPGRTLADHLSDAATTGEPLPVAQLLEWCGQIARALACAHGHGEVHRAETPSNVRIARAGRAMLLDFGLARLSEITEATLTRTFAGSPRYAAPEQLAGAEVDGRADVYALGATLYHALTGRVPNAGNSLEEIVRRALPGQRFNPQP